MDGLGQGEAVREILLLINREENEQTIIND